MKTLLLTLLLTLTSCTNTMKILEGTTHAKGRVHVEGFATDAEADLELCKVPAEYTVDQAIAYCS